MKELSKNQIISLILIGIGLSAAIGFFMTSFSSNEVDISTETTIEVSAQETKRATITTLYEVQDLAVNFRFDVEVVDIIFISPDETVYSEAIGNLKISTGNLWSTYRIKNAQTGDWQVEYNLGANSSIEYTIIENNLGITITSLNISSINENIITTSFYVKSTSNDDFEYEIYAVDNENSSDMYLMQTGTANCNEDIIQNVSLADIADGDYYLIVSVTTPNSSVELFDSKLSETFSYINPNSPNTITDYSVRVDASNLQLTINWEEYYDSSYDGYQIIVINTSDNNTIIFDNEIINSIYEVEVIFPQTATELLVKVRYQDNGVWTTYNEKSIPISTAEYLYLDDEDITSNSQIALNYYVITPNTSIYIEVNDNQISNDLISEQGYLTIDLIQGINTVYAYFIGENNVIYEVEKEIYCTAL